MRNPGRAGLRKDTEIMGILDKIIGTYSERQVKKLMHTVRAIEDVYKRQP